VDAPARGGLVVGLDLFVGLVGRLLGDLAELAAMLLALFFDSVGDAAGGVLHAGLDLLDGLLHALGHLGARLLRMRLELLALKLGLRDGQPGCKAGCRCARRDGDRLVLRDLRGILRLGLDVLLGRRAVGQLVLDRRGVGSLSLTFSPIPGPPSPLPSPTPGTFCLSWSTFSIMTSFLSSRTSFPRFLTSAL
jgi:hypothetical protein